MVVGKMACAGYVIRRMYQGALGMGSPFLQYKTATPESVTVMQQMYDIGVWGERYVFLTFKIPLH